MQNTFRWDVFISHASRDKARVRPLAEALRAAGLEVWLDEWVIQPGDHIYLAVEQGLEAARTLVLCLTTQALTSEWVKLERGTALFRDPTNKERRFVPVLLEDCKLPDVLKGFAYVDWRDESAAALEKIIQACRPAQRKAKRSKTAPNDLEPPSGAMGSESPLYLERAADAEAIAAAQRSPATLVIKAPRQMGKSSLLNRYLFECQQAGKQTALLYLSDFEESELADYPTFLTQLAQALWQALGEPPQAAPPSLRSQRELTKYLERSLLAAFDEPVVFAFDEIDRVMGRAWQSDFTTMLRNWHERRSSNPPTVWARLGMVLVTSTEPYLFIKDYARSPFNIGLQIELPPFDEQGCQKLNRLYQARLRAPQIRQMIELLNGHPYLTQLAFYHLTRPAALDFAALKSTATERHGPFGAHLRALEYRLEDAGLLDAMKELATNGTQPDRDSFYRLHGAGLVNETGRRVTPANQLYARFFGVL